MTARTSGVATGRRRSLFRRPGPGEQELLAAELPETALSLAVLLGSGLTPDRGWVHLAESGSATAARVVQQLRLGMGVSDAIAGAGTATGWHELAQAWQIAARVGAPLADTLRGLAEALRDLHATRDEVRTALAEPAGTARLMAWLPAVSVLLGVALGFDTIGVLISNPIGWVCLAAGVCLMFAAARWTAALVRRSQATLGVPGMRADLLAIALSGGVSIGRARELVAHVMPADSGDEAESALELSRRAGVPAAELLRASARLARHRARVQGRMHAAALSTRLLLPLGVCTLPAFLLLGVAPLVLSVFASGVISL